MIPIRQNLVPVSRYAIKCPYHMTASCVVVHNTGMDAPADNEIRYMISNSNEVSYHFAVDDKEVVQGVPLTRNTWNADNDKGNREGISIEICYSKSGGPRFDQAEKNAAKLIAQLLKERNWGIDKVTKHQDYNGKYCPHRTLDRGWPRFLDMIKAELKGDDDMTKEETQALFKAEYDKMNPAYNYVSEVPGWAKEDTQALVDLGILKGDGKTQLGGLRLDPLRTLIGALRLQEKKYDEVCELPKSMQAEVQALVDKGVIKGNGKTTLGGMTYSTLRAVMISSRDK